MATKNTKTSSSSSCSANSNDDSGKDGRVCSTTRTSEAAATTLSATTYYSSLSSISSYLWELIDVEDDDSCKPYAWTYRAVEKQQEATPAPYLWISGSVDLFCDGLQATVPSISSSIGCTDWRSSWLGVEEVSLPWSLSSSSSSSSATSSTCTTTSSSPWAYRVPYLMDSLFLDTMSYAQFRRLQQPQQQQQQGSQSSTAATTTTRNNNLFQEWKSKASHELESMYTFAFQTSSTSLSNLVTRDATVVLFLLVLILRQIKKRLLPLFSSWGRAAGRRTHGPTWEMQKQNEERIQKFGEYVFRLLFHSAISFYGLYFFVITNVWSGNNNNSSGGSNASSATTVPSLPTTHETIAYWRGFPHHEVPPDMCWYYLLQAAYNADAMLSLLEISLDVRLQWPLQRRRQQKSSGSSSTSTSTRSGCALASPIVISWSPTVRGDFQEMLAHHIVTNLLVFCSSFCRLHRAGSMVFMIHDVSDVPVDLSKLANFLKKKYTTLCCFLTMVAMWGFTRLYILPFILFRSVLTQSYAVLEQGLPPIFFVYYRPLFDTLMSSLILLHTAWFFMFLQIFATFLQKNECHDYSEHKHGEDDHQQQQQEELSPSSTDAAAAASSLTRTISSTSTIKTSNSSAGKKTRTTTMNGQRQERYGGEEKKDN